MMPRKRLLAMLCALLSSSAGACNQNSELVQTQSASSPGIVTPYARFAVSGDVAIVTLAVDVQGNVGKIGSFTGRLHFDATALSFLGEVALDDGALRASNPGATEIRVAGAGTSGIDPMRVAELRFAVRDAKALQGLRFDLDELHEVSRTDLRSAVQASSAARAVR